MNKKLIYTAILSLLIGLILIIIGSITGGIKYVRNTDIDNFSDILNDNKSGSSTYSNHTKELKAFSNLDFDLNYSNLTIKKSKNNKYYVEYSDTNEDDYEISIENNTLKIVENTYYNNNVFININPIKELLINGNFGIFRSRGIILYTPKSEFDDITINHKFGYVHLDSIKSNVFNISNSAGKIDIEHCEGGKFNINNSKGKINIEHCDGDEYVIKQNMGKVSFSDISVKKLFDVDSEMGAINGDILYDESKYYNVDTSEELGKIFVDPKFMNSNTKSNEKVEIKLNIEMGDIKLKAK